MVKRSPSTVSRQNFYGFSGDFLQTEADIATGHLIHAFSDAVSLDAQVRYANCARESRITEPLITQSVTPLTPLTDISVFRYVFLGDSEETLFTSQAVITAALQTGAIQHSIATEFEISQEASAPIFAFGIGAPDADLLNPNSNIPFAASTDPRVIADTEGQTLAFYALDTLKLGNAWMVTLGARWDRFDTDYDALRFSGPPTPFNAGNSSGTESFDRVDKVASYRAAPLYKPMVNTSLHVTGSTSFNPSAQSLSLLSTGRGLGVSDAALDPEENRSIEAGVKVDLKNGAMMATGAEFEITKTNARVPDPNTPGLNTLGGAQRIRGLSIDLNGTLTEKIYLSASYTYLDGEVIKAAPGAAAGAALANAPEHSFSAWVNYRITDRLKYWCKWALRL